MLYPNSTTIPGESGVVHALGQTWYFTQGAIRALRIYGAITEFSLKAVVIELTTYDGLEGGIHEVKFSHVPLRLYVDGSQVVVEDPDHPND
jgi:hypothetical protein